MNATHDASHIVGQFAKNGVLSFATGGEFGGERRGRAAVGEFFALLFRAFPDVSIVPIDVIVRGWPWNTVVATRFRVGATLPDGTAYANEGMQYVRLSFGRILEDRIYEDSDKLERTLDRIRTLRA